MTATVPSAQKLRKSDTPDVPPSGAHLSRSRTAPFEHRVQFYENEGFLYGVITDFFTTGLWAQEPLVVIATEAHRRGLTKHLESSGCDVARLCGAGTLTMLDARETLMGFMVGEMPDRTLFRKRIGGLIERISASSRGGRVRGFVEMVDLLWRDGNAPATIRLEELWVELGQSHSMAMLCGYSMGDSHGEAPEQLERICGIHSHVVPTEIYPRNADSDVRLREVSLLQQRARAWEGEIAHRKQLELALGRALAERKQSVEALRAVQQEQADFFTRHIGDRKRLENEVRRQSDDLSRTVRFNKIFVGILGHDLRNPLSAITTATSLLQRRADSDKVAKPAARILNSAGRMGRMIDQLLDFTQIRLGKGISIEPTQTNLAEVCRLAIDAFESTGEGHRTELNIFGDSVGLWDADRLLQLLSNLLDSAVTYGTSSQMVVVSVDGTADGIAVEVKTAGVVPPDLLPLLFEPLRNGSNEKHQWSIALGLGLFIGQQIVLAHAGSINVTSSAADGTRFVVRLPRSPPRSAPAFRSVGGQA